MSEFGGTTGADGSWDFDYDEYVGEQERRWKEHPEQWLGQWTPPDGPGEQEQPGLAVEPSDRPAVGPLRFAYGPAGNVPRQFTGKGGGGPGQGPE